MTRRNRSASFPPSTETIRPSFMWQVTGSWYAESPGPSVVNPRCERHGIESNGTLARNIARFGWDQYIGAGTGGKVNDKTGLAGHDLTRVSGILSKLLLDIVLGEHDAKISSFRIGDMNIDVLAATKHIPGFGI